MSNKPTEVDALTKLGLRVQDMTGHGMIRWIPGQQIIDLIEKEIAEYEK